MNCDKTSSFKKTYFSGKGCHSEPAVNHKHDARWQHMFERLSSKVELEIDEVLNSCDPKSLFIYVCNS